MYLKPTVDKALEKIQIIFSKSRWMKDGKTLSNDALRKCFFCLDIPYLPFSHQNPKRNTAEEIQKMISD